jgi:hypothetical protein
MQIGTQPVDWCMEFRLKKKEEMVEEQYLIRKKLRGI